MISTLQRGANASFRAVYLLAGPLFVAATIILLIDALPLATAGLSVNSMLKGLIAVPVGVAFAFGASHRRFLATLLVATMCLLLLCFTWLGYPQNDQAVETAIGSLLALSLWLTLPFLLPRALHLKDPPGAVALWRAATVVWSSVGAYLSASRLRSWSNSIAWSARASIVAVALCALVVVALSIVSLAGRIDAAALLRIGLLSGDAVVGAGALWLLAQRLLGKTSAAAAALLWAACSVRLEFSGLGGAVMLPTFAVPAVALLLLRARDRGFVRGPWFALALSATTLALCWFWPLLALSVALATVFLSWSAGYVREARWAVLALVVWALVVCFAIPDHTVARLGLESSLRDPTHAAAACASGCDGGLPWEVLYPSPFGSIYAGVVTALLTSTLHWGNYQTYAISPGWAQLALAIVGAAVLWRRRRRGLLAIWMFGIMLGIALSLPSHYLGLGLPSLTRLVTSVAPSFTDGAQMSVLSALFMVLLAGTGAGALVFHGATVRLLPALACVGFVLADIVSVPVPGHPGSVLAKLSAQIPARGDAPVQVAFYPFLTPDYGPEYHELAGIARRHGLALVNAGGDENGLSDLSNPQVQDRLRAMGVSFVVVSVPDYVRRREMLDEAHVLLPVDQEGNAVSWLAPEPGELVRLHVIRADIDGSLLLAP